MHRRTLQRQSLIYHGRTNVAVVLGVAVGAAALTGALVVGDSMRGSLRETAIGRLGGVDQALVSNRFVQESLAATIAKESHQDVCPAIMVNGSIAHADTGARANRINALGVDERFWRLSARDKAFDVGEERPRSVVINQPLADELHADVGDDVLLRFGKAGAISTETLLGRRDDTTATLRLAVRAVIPAEDIGAFSLSPRHVLPLNAYVPLATLQRSLDRRDRVNAMFVACKGGDTPSAGSCGSLQDVLDKNLTLDDVGLRLRVNDKLGYIALESEGMLVEPAIERAAREAAGDAGFDVSGVQSYLANRISADGNNTSGIPFSTVAAIDPEGPTARAMITIAGDKAEALQPGEIILNQWAADDLRAGPGDRITLEYYVTGALGRLETQRQTFMLRTVVGLTGAAADPGFVPEYTGVTDTDNLADWDPPFPMQLSAIRDKDERYWDEYKTTPKAFITLVDGKRLWAEQADRFGTLTSIRLRPTDPSVKPSGAASDFATALTQLWHPSELDLTFDPVRQRLLDAGAGTTDFGVLFVSFSFFLIGSAAMLVALLFRLGVERRAGEIGLLLATGFSPRTVSRLLLGEGLVLATVGSVLGVACSLGYAWLMLAGLRSWWSAAVNAPFLRMHASSLSLGVGFASGVLVALASIAWSIRGLTRLSPTSLLAGVVASGRERVGQSSKRKWLTPTLMFGGFFLAGALALWPVFSDSAPAAGAFFGSGAAMLTACLAMFARRLSGDRAGVIHRAGSGALVRLGMRNARRRVNRSVMTASLFASATFLIAALEAFHVDPAASSTDRFSGTGGFTYYAESSVPLVYDLNTPAGREALNIDPVSASALDDVLVLPLRLRTGDDSSCLNLYRPTKPRIAGATDALIERGGFQFGGTMAETDAERTNPWLLLRRTFSDGTIPVIGDESAVLWQLHLGLGKDLEIEDEHGETVRLRFVALLKGSMLQDELVVSETDFSRLFPSISGYSFFLVETPDEPSDAASFLESELAAFGFDTGSSRSRLAAYLAVQNTYLATFQTLGGFGLILGTIGLAAVLLRNVWERRGELALLRALGFSRRAIGGVVLAENLVLLLVGLAAGSLSAMLAIAPHIATRASSIPWSSLGLTLAGVLALGVSAAMIAVRSALRSPLLPSLRAE